MVPLRDAPRRSNAPASALDLPRLLGSLRVAAPSESPRLLVVANHTRKQRPLAADTMHRGLRIALSISWSSTVS
jgi:hypothetical protein